MFVLWGRAGCNKPSKYNLTGVRPMEIMSTQTYTQSMNQFETKTNTSTVTERRRPARRRRRRQYQTQGRRRRQSETRRTARYITAAPHCTLLLLMHHPNII